MSKKSEKLLRHSMSKVLWKTYRRNLSKSSTSQLRIHWTLNWKPTTRKFLLFVSTTRGDVARLAISAFAFEAFSAVFQLRCFSPFRLQVHRGCRFASAWRVYRRIKRLHLSRFRTRCARGWSSLSRYKSNSWGLVFSPTPRSASFRNLISC